MTDVFERCQRKEAQRLQTIKDTMFSIHKCLNIAEDPTYVAHPSSIHNFQTTSDKKYQKGLNLELHTRLCSVGVVNVYPSYSQGWVVKLEKMFVQCQILCEVSIHKEVLTNNTILTPKC